MKTDLYSHYPFRLHFTKNFTGGRFESTMGANMRDSLPFVSRESAERWIAGITKYEKRNGWKLGDYSLEENK